MNPRNHDLYGINLHRIRTERKLSRRKLAEAAKVSQWTVTNIERLNVRASLYTALMIADALQVGIEKLTEEVKI